MLKTSWPDAALQDSAKLFGTPRVFRQACRLGPPRKSVAAHKFLTPIERESLCRDLERKSRRR